MKTVEEKLYEIGEVLLKANANKCGLEGNLGMALFLLFFSNLNNDERYYDKSIKLIEQELSCYSEHLENLTFWTGIAGLGWYCNAMVKKYIDSEYDAGFAAIDELLENQMLICNNSGLYYYDHLHGGLGFGHYFLTADKKAAIASLVEKMHGSAIEDYHTKGKKWKTNTEHLSEHWDYNISLSHGMSSIVIMLTKILQKGIEREKCAELIEGAVNYFLAQKLPKGNHTSVFGNYALESMEQPHSSRLAWCYGDLGIAVALWRASQALGRKDWEGEAKALLRHALPLLSPTRFDGLRSGLPAHGGAALRAALHPGEPAPCPGSRTKSAKTGESLPRTDIIQHNMQIVNELKLCDKKRQKHLTNKKSCIFAAKNTSKYAVEKEPKNLTIT